MAALLSVENLTHGFGARTLFSGVTFAVNEGDRLGMIGPNGTGKSTLLKILAGADIPVAGTRAVRKGARVAYLAQEDVFPPGASIRSAVESALDGLGLEDHERWVRVDKQLSRMSFPDPDKPVDQLSGGWRKRVALARQLVLDPELLLLDEPTNHLDLDGIFWLEEFLSKANLTFLVVSHDRYLLENTCNRVVELSPAYPQGSFSVDGPYSRFLEKREEFLAGQAQAQKSLANKVRREVEWLQRGAKARTTKAQYRIDEAGRMMANLADLSNRNASNKKVTVDFTTSERRANRLIQFDKVTMSRGGRTLFSDLSFFLEPGQKLGLLGSNGSGKSTLVKLMTGQLTPDSGVIKVADGVRVALFDQNRAQLQPTELLRQALAPQGDQVVFQGKPVHIEAWSRRFLFRSEQLDLPLAQLSGGEQARVLLARMMLVPADVLILDEPTNDLDIPSLEVLENSLRDFPGAVVLITHDRYLLEQVSNTILGLDGEGGTGFFSTFERWQEARELALAAKAEALRLAEAASRAATKSSVPTEPAKPARSKGLNFKEKKEWEGMEVAIEQAEAEVARVNAVMTDPAVMNDRARLQQACRELELAHAKVEQLYARWQELEAKLSSN